MKLSYITPLSHNDCVISTYSKCSIILGTQTIGTIQSLKFTREFTPCFCSNSSDLSSSSHSTYVQGVLYRLWGLHVLSHPLPQVYFLYTNPVLICAANFHQAKLYKKHITNSFPSMFICPWIYFSPKGTLMLVALQKALFIYCLREHWYYSSSIYFSLDYDIIYLNSDIYGAFSFWSTTAMHSIEVGDAESESQHGTGRCMVLLETHSLYGISALL